MRCVRARDGSDRRVRRLAGRQSGFISRGLYRWHRADAAVAVVDIGLGYKV
jgi:hypothetical protein